MHGNTARRNVAAFGVLMVVALLSGCGSDPVSPPVDASDVPPGRLVQTDSAISAFGSTLVTSTFTNQTSPWYAGWSTLATDSVGNALQYVGVRPSTAVPVRTTMTYLNGVIRERRTLLWEPAVGGWELVRVTSTFYNANGSIYTTRIQTPDQLGLTSFLSSTCVSGLVNSMSGCFSGTVRSVAGFVGLVATAPAVAAAAPPTLGGTAVAWLAGWAVWTADLIDTVEACSASGSGGTATQKPKKRLT
ncbi:MAG: hypothetical protein H7099_06135 [Gemmatimonadaceae bacterium]|nr:hypothetical protein [Gemmatimonadaceae bacterium]